MESEIIASRVVNFLHDSILLVVQQSGTPMGTRNCTLGVWAHRHDYFLSAAMLLSNTRSGGDWVRPLFLPGLF